MVAINEKFCLFIGLKNDIWLWVAGIELLGFSYEMVSLCISEMMKMVEARSKPRL